VTDRKNVKRGKGISVRTLKTKGTKNRAAASTSEAAPIDTPAREAQAAEPVDSMLARLMRRALAGRRRMEEAQSRLRDVELEVRTVSGEKRSRFERLRAAALDEYRSARADAAQARRQLLSTLRLLPDRS
jgi:hypothetical protein